MKVGLELFHLVKSLTVGENSIVRRSLPPKKDAIYDVFKKMEHYDSAVVKAAFPGMSEANIATTEHQLIDLILKLLWNSAPKHGMRDLVFAIGKVELLSQKRLHSLAFAKVEETIKLALELDAMNELLKALRLKKEVLDVLRHAEPADEEDIALLKWATARMEENSKFEDLQTAVVTLKNTKPERKAEILAEIDRMIAALPQPVLKKNQISFHWCLHRIAYTKGEFWTAQDNAVAVVGLMEQNEAQFGDVQLRAEYFGALHYIIVLENEEGRHETARAGLEKFERMAKRLLGGVASDPNLYARFAHASLWVILCAKDWEAVKIRVRHISKELIAPGSLFLYKHKPIWLRMTLLAAFVVGEYGLVRRLGADLRRALSNAYVGSAFVTSTTLFQLAAIYEEGDDFLGQAVINARAWLREMGCQGPFETAMLEFFEEAGKQAPAPVPAYLLLSLKSKLELIFEDQLLWQHKEQFPILQWIQSKVSMVEFREVLFP